MSKPVKSALVVRSIRLSARDWRKILELAKARGLSLSDYIRAQALAPALPGDAADAHRLLRALCETLETVAPGHCSACRRHHLADPAMMPGEHNRANWTCELCLP